MSSHRFHLDSMPPQRTNTFGSRTDVNQLDFPVLSGIALSLLQLSPKGMREPHWHPNANELSYCIQGRALMTIFNPGAAHDTLIIEPGTLAFVPMGALHHIENIGDVPLKMVLCFDNGTPEDLDLSSSLSVMPEHVLAATFQMNKSFFSGLQATDRAAFIVEKSEKPQVIDSWKTNRFKFDLEAIQPQINTSGGWVKVSNASLFSTLNGLAAFSLDLKEHGVREPHWHPNAHELNYLMSGVAQITILSPGGNVDTFDMKAGDASFIPKGYLHHIENTGKSPARFVVFFNNSTPSDIGLSGSIGAYSNEVLAALFQVPASYFDKLPKYQSDLFVVKGGG